jgi:hypothetical protein
VKRSKSPFKSPAANEWPDVFSVPPGESDVNSPVERLNSIETKIAPIFSRIAVLAQ